jgi:hypothetical protein
MPRRLVHAPHPHGLRRCDFSSQWHSTLVSPMPPVSVNSSSWRRGASRLLRLSRFVRFLFLLLLLNMSALSSSASNFTTFDRDIIGSARWDRPPSLRFTAVFAIGFRAAGERGAAPAGINRSADRSATLQTSSYHFYIGCHSARAPRLRQSLRAAGKI